MKHLSSIFTVSLLLAGLIITINSDAREIPVPPATPVVAETPAYKVPAIEKLGNGVYKIGDILINKGDKSLSFPAQVNMEMGILEYLIVYRSGKTHESLLRTNVTPYNLQVAFMLLGYEGTDKRLMGQGSPEVPQGEPVRITVSNVADTQTAAFPVEQWLVNKTGETTKDVAPLNWVFCGSYVNPYGEFMSQITGSIAAIWHDPVAMIDNASPGGESNRLWYVKQGSVPPVGTIVTVTIKPAK